MVHLQHFRIQSCCCELSRAPPPAPAPSAWRPDAPRPSGYGCCALLEMVKSPSKTNQITPRNQSSSHLDTRQIPSKNRSSQIPFQRPEASQIPSQSRSNSDQILLESGNIPPRNKSNFLEICTFPWPKPTRGHALTTNTTLQGKLKHSMYLKASHHQPPVSQRPSASQSGVKQPTWNQTTGAPMLLFLYPFPSSDDIHPKPSQHSVS